MAKYWFGSLEQITEQKHDSGGHAQPVGVKAVKGWRTIAKDYPLIERKAQDDDTRKYWIRNFLPKWLVDWIPKDQAHLAEMEKDRTALAEQWWEDAEIWWKGQQQNKDLLGKVDDTRILDYVPIRETGDYQLRITGPVEVPDRMSPPIPEKEKSSIIETAKKGAK